jgi:hypothetical protein
MKRAAICGLIAASVLIPITAHARGSLEDQSYEIVTRAVSSAQAAPYVPIEEVPTEAALVKTAQAVEKAPAKIRKVTSVTYQNQSDLMSHWAAVMDQLGTVHKTTLLRMIKCESGGREKIVVWDVHSNSYGILQFKTPTWDWFSQKAGISGSPLDGAKAIQVADWALSNNLGHHWTCR